MSRWYIGDMDDGILIVRDTRRACLTWAKDASLATRVVGVHRYGPGRYEYTVAAEDPEDCTSYFIARLDTAETDGFAPGQEPLYGDPENPHLRTRREDDDEDW